MTKLPAQFSWDIFPGRFTATAAPVRLFISRAYGVPEWRIVDEPRWASDERYDIQARIDGTATRDQVYAMLRALLIDRFRLKAHAERREVDVEFLEVSDRGGRATRGLHAVVVDCETRRVLEGSTPGLFFNKSRIACGANLYSRSLAGGVVTSKFSAITKEGLADRLSSILGRPVLERTRLTGQYDIQLSYMADSPVAAPGSGSPFNVDQGTGPSLRTALEEQLGLKLMSGRGSIDFIVVDSVERPRIEDN